jgi:hypothetical protein
MARISMSSRNYRAQYSGNANLWRQSRNRCTLAGDDLTESRKMAATMLLVRALSVARASRPIPRRPHSPPARNVRSTSSAKDLEDHSLRDGRIYHSPIDVRVEHFRIVKVERVDRKDISIKHDEITRLPGSKLPVVFSCFSAYAALIVYASTMSCSLIPSSGKSGSRS